MHYHKIKILLNHKTKRDSLHKNSIKEEDAMYSRKKCMTQQDIIIVKYERRVKKWLPKHHDHI